MVFGVGLNKRDGSENWKSVYESKFLIGVWQITLDIDIRTTQKSLKYREYLNTGILNLLYTQGSRLTI